MSSFKDCNDVRYPVDEKVLVIRIALNVHIKKDDVEQQERTYSILHAT